MKCCYFISTKDILNFQVVLSVVCNLHVLLSSLLSLRAPNTTELSWTEKHQIQHRKTTYFGFKYLQSLT